MLARQDELQRQLLTFQEQQLAFQAQQTAMMAALGRLRDSASSNTAPRHIISQASYSSATESVSAAATAPCLESAFLDTTAPGFIGCHLFWL